MFEDGVRFYTEKQAVISVYFPEGHETCQYCRPFCRYEDSFKRYSCRLTDEWLIDPMHTKGKLCPLMEVSNGRTEKTV